MAFSITVVNNPLGRSIDAQFDTQAFNFSWVSSRHGMPRLHATGAVRSRYMDSSSRNAVQLAQSLKEDFEIEATRMEIQEFANEVWKQAEKLKVKSFEA